MSGGENETVAVDPFRIFRIVVQCLSEECGSDFGCAERKSEVSGRAGCDSIDGKAPRLIGGFRECGKSGIHMGDRVMMKPIRDSRKNATKH
ncbi:MAG: hypothetical protein BWY82_01940 [Verrucomicrobia bacterium ADurb.Bin474]|nr:MAG: hypothetical protein BWY82_01940 [Verrucomicrobia bacterium ADurb.Bin474]